MSLRRACLGLCGGLSLSLGCAQASSEPPPPPRKAEILPAPPRAVGARAAGTDAAPKPEVAPAPEPESLPSFPVPSAEPDAGTAPDPSSPPSPADAGTAL